MPETLHTRCRSKALPSAILQRDNGPSYTPLQEPTIVFFVRYLQERGLIRGVDQARQIQATAEDSHRIGNQKTWEGPFRV